MRSTKTWSPMSRVSSIELEGISKACRLKVMMNSPVTRTTAIEAMNSSVVSFFSSCADSGVFLSFFAKVVCPCPFRISLRRSRRREGAAGRLLHDAERATPAGQMQDLSQVPGPGQFTIRAIVLAPAAEREIDD